ncbi:MAG: Rv3235 family protein [Nocardioidaceae bacterium]|nr:Rv3235 family protein [Nocardioidaceae bacterium]
MTTAPDLIGLRLSVPVAPTQGTLALTLVPRQAPPSVRGARTQRGSSVVSIDRRMQHSIEERAHRFCQAAVEIVAGDRPVSQVVRWTSREVHADLRRRAHLVARAGGHQPGLARVQTVRPHVESVHSCFVCEDVVECAVRVRYGDRSRAIAARFERVDERWICTALDFA